MEEERTRVREGEAENNEWPRERMRRYFVWEEREDKWKMNSIYTYHSKDKILLFIDAKNGENYFVHNIS